MTKPMSFRRAGVALACMALAACGGGDGDGGEPAADKAGAGDAWGLDGTAAVRLSAAVPSANGDVRVEPVKPGGGPALPTGLAAQGRTFAFKPPSADAGSPMTVTLPFDPAQVPPGATPQLYRTNPQGQWEPVPGASFDANTVTANLTGPSFVQVGVSALQRNDPLRLWTFSTYPGSGLGPARVLLPGGSGSLSGGTLEEVAEFGPAPLDLPVIMTTQTLPPDGKANGFVYSSADGVTYLVAAEAPYSAAVAGSQRPVGSRTELQQFQSFVKRSADATMSFTLTNVVLIAEDYNTRADLSKLIRAEVLLNVHAYTTTANYFYVATGTASVSGRGSLYVPDARMESWSTHPLWSIDDFDMSITDVSYPLGDNLNTCPGKRGRLVLKKPRTYNVDLSSVNVGQTFTMRVDTYGEAVNRRGGEAVGDCQFSRAFAFLRDPQQVGGSTLAFTGLTPTNQPLLPPPPDGAVVPPAACTGPRAGAGVLQFSAPAYSIGEHAGAEQTVTVTRTGGSSGAVSATLASTGGTAVAGTDYTALAGTVVFGDGDTTPRRVTLPITPNGIGGQFNRNVVLQLSPLGNCAALGAQTSTIVNIVDDDPVPAGFALDPSFGVQGEALFERFGGDRSSMAVQADGKIVMAGGTFTDFILARFNADGTVDRGFGFLGDGTVTTDMGSGFISEEATAVAVQADGRIVVAGYTAIDNAPPNPDGPPTFALARYTADGRLDTSFGRQGRVSGNVNGRARAMAIQPDGKIVVAGEFSFASTNGSDFSDVTLARFHPDGNLDMAFGADATGQIARDLGGSNSARNIVLQSDGKIVVSGATQAVQFGPFVTDVARFNADGSFDTTFGSGGKLKLPGLAVGDGLALQADGKLVLVGSVLQPTPPVSSRFLLLRLNTDGTPDSGFGTAGKVDLALAQNAAAGSVAVQADGKIVVVGTEVAVSVADFVVARYNADGSLDTGFGIAGSLAIDFANAGAVGENVVVLPDGRIVVGGAAGNRGGFEGYGVARLLP